MAFIYIIIVFIMKNRLDLTTLIFGRVKIDGQNTVPIEYNILPYL